MTDALSAQGLVKNFGGTLAVAGLDLVVPQGSLFGFVGPNGAGKTTTLSMCTGLLRPDAGRVQILGDDVWADPAHVKTKLGILPDGLRLFDRLRGRELLQYVGRIRGLDRAVVQERSDELLSVLDLVEAQGRTVADYSAGMTKKIGLACALLHAPQVLVLDEPFEAVDPVSGNRIRAILRDFVAGGGTVILSSHVMELVETLCDRVAVVHHGRLLAAGTLDEVRQGAALQDRFVQLVGGTTEGEQRGISWLRH